MHRLFWIDHRQRMKNFYCIAAMICAARQTLMESAYAELKLRRQLVRQSICNQQTYFGQHQIAKYEEILRRQMVPTLSDFIGLKTANLCTLAALSNMQTIRWQMQNLIASIHHRMQHCDWATRAMSIWFLLIKTSTRRFLSSSLTIKFIFFFIKCYINIICACSSTG